MAYGLQKRLAMKRIVGFLAVAACITGCGVGVDDPEGLAAVMESSFALGSNTTVQVDSPSAQQNNTPRSGTPLSLFGAPISNLGGGTVSAPQDPIPAFDPLMGPPVSVPPGHPLPR